MSDSLNITKISVIMMKQRSNELSNKLKLNFNLCLNAPYGARHLNFQFRKDSNVATMAKLELTHIRPSSWILLEISAKVGMGKFFRKRFNK